MFSLVAHCAAVVVSLLVLAGVAPLTLNAAHVKGKGDGVTVHKKAVHDVNKVVGKQSDHASVERSGTKAKHELHRRHSQKREAEPEVDKLQPDSTLLQLPSAFRASKGQAECKTLLMVMAVTDVRQGWKRQSLRDSWAVKYTNPSMAEFRYFFLVGRLWEHAPPSIVSESKEHEDVYIAQANEFDFMDYTRKVLMGMRAAAEHCKFDYFLKVTEFTFINPFSLLPWLQRLPRTGVYCGHVAKGAVPQRDPYSPWFISVENYERDRYPTLPTNVYLFSHDVFSKAMQMDGRYLNLYYDDAAFAVYLSDNNIHPTHEDSFAPHSDCKAPIVIELGLDGLVSYGENMRDRSNHAQCY